MDYGRFVRLRSPIWDAFEADLAAVTEESLRGRRRRRSLDHDGLEDLAFRYRQVLHDHALAASRFPNTGVARRLRRLSLAGTRFLVHEEKPSSTGVVGFFTRVFPEALARRRGMLAVAAGLFLATALFGLAVTLVSPALGVAFLGPEAVEGMEQGRMWTDALTTTVPPAASSSGIATNNVSVALTAWAGGALAGLLGFYIIGLNGLMLGAVIGVTLHYGMTPQLLTFVAAHGPLELTTIVVSAAGGLTLGWGLVASTDRPRSEVLGEAAKDALVILGGALPWLLILALVEVFISPMPTVPTVLKVTLGLALEVTFLTFAFRPWVWARATSRARETGEVAMESTR